MRAAGRVPAWVCQGSQIRALCPSRACARTHIAWRAHAPPNAFFCWAREASKGDVSVGLVALLWHATNSCRTHAPPPSAPSLPERHTMWVKPEAYTTFGLEPPWRRVHGSQYREAESGAILLDRARHADALEWVW